LVPGTYETTFRLYMDDPDNSLVLRVTAYHGVVALALLELPPGSLMPAKWNLVNVAFYSDGAYTGGGVRRAGALVEQDPSLGGVVVRQLGALSALG
jgi:hypothetical protein